MPLPEITLRSTTFRFRIASGGAVIFGLLFTFLGLAAPVKARAAEPADPGAHYAGMNLWFLNDWDGSNAFANVAMHARAWQKRNWNDGLAIIDAEGWPTEDASTVVFGKDNQLGTYKLVVEGQVGAITLMWTSGSVSNLAYDPATNTTTADITLTNNNTGGLTLSNTRRTAASPLNSGFRNLRLYRPGHATDGSELFDQRFLALMAPFHVIRYMDWVDANKNGEVSWSGRWRPGMARRPNYAHQSQSGLTHGIPIEYMIALSNRLNADMWLNIPTWADDDYVTKTALALRYGTDGTNPYTSPQANPVWPPLNPDLKVYVEYSNEVWNSASGFRNFPWVLGIADAIIADPAPHPTKLNITTGAYDESDRYTIQARYTAWRSARISDLFRSVWGDAEINNRIRVALMGQIGGGYFNNRQLPWLDAFYNRTRPGTDPFPNSTLRPVSSFFYGTGGSSYYGVNTWSTDPDVFFAPGNYPDTRWLDRIPGDALRARNYGLKRIAYEGGMGLDLFNRSGYPAATNAEKEALNADPRMTTLVETFHDTWTAFGGDLLVYYVNTSALDWQFTPNVWDLDTAKMIGVRSVINDRRRVPVTFGQEIPGTLVARNHTTRDVVGGVFDTTIGTLPGLGGLGAGESIAFPINTRSYGAYRVRARFATNTTANLQFHLGGVPVGAAFNVSGSSNTTLLYGPWVEVPVNSEFNAIRLTTNSGSINLYSIEFEYLGLGITTNSPLPAARAGTAYSTTLSVGGGTAPYTWSLDSGTLPAGISLNASTGVLSGTPSATGTASFTLRVTDANLVTTTRAFSLAVTNPPVITTTSPLPGAQAGTSYSRTFTGSGGVTPYAWSVASGSLPPGLALNASTGVLSGTPTTAGNYAFTLSLTDSFAGATAVTAAFTLAVAPAPGGTTYTLTYAAGTGGTLSGATTQTVASGGSGTPVTALPDEGYTFTQWSDSSTANPRTDTNVTANRSVTAQFTFGSTGPVTYTLTYAAGTGGTLSGPASQTVEAGASGAPVTAVPDEGYTFTQWSDGSTGNPRIDNGVSANLSVTAQFASVSTTSGLILHYTFDAGSGTAISDSSPEGNNHSAVVARATWTASGKFGNAYGPSSASSSIANGGIVPTNSGDLLTNPRTHAYSFSTWVKVAPGTSVGYRTLLDQSNDGGTQVRIWTTNSWSSLTAIVGGTSINLTLPSGGTLADGNWHLLTLVNYNDNGTWRFRLYHNDGATFAEGNSGTATSSASLRFGALSNGSNRWWGNMDDLRFYNNALSASQVYTLYHGATSAPPSGPAILHYTFNEGTGTAIADTSTSGNNHSTTVSGATWTTSGKFGNAYGPAAANSSIATGGIIPANASDLNFAPRADAFTVSIWVKVAPGTSVGYRTLFDKSESANTQFRLWTNNSWSSLDATVGSTTVTFTLPNSGTLADGNWHLLTLVNYSDAGTWRFRLYHNDGASFAQGLSGSTATNNGTLRIGTLSGGFNTWRGNLDDLRIYNRALSAREVASLYAGTLDTPPASTYTVTFNASGGAAPNPATKTVTAGATYDALATTTRAGYKFLGWFTAASGGTEVTASTTVALSANQTLFAQWEAIPPYDLWTASDPEFSSLPEAQRLPLSDPDADGLPNLLEYALGGDPLIPGSASLPEPATTTVSGQHRLTLGFTPASTAGLRYHIEASSNLSDWSDVSDVTALLTPGQPFTHTDSANLGENPRRFLRLRVIALNQP